MKPVTSYFQIFLMWIFLRTMCIYKVIENLHAKKNHDYLHCCLIDHKSKDSNTCACFFWLMVFAFKFGCKPHKMGTAKINIQLN